MAVLYNNLSHSQHAQEKLAAAESTAALAAENLRQHPMSVYLRADLMLARGALDSAFVLLDSLQRARGADVDVRNRAGSLLSSIEAVRGRLRESTRWARQSREAAREQVVAKVVPIDRPHHRLGRVLRNARLEPADACVLADVVQHPPLAHCAAAVSCSTFRIHMLPGSASR